MFTLDDLLTSYNGTLYYFRKNLQGDDTGIYNANGTLVVEYEHTPYGAIYSTTGSMIGSRPCCWW